MAVRGTGAPGLTNTRLHRMLALKFDGRPLGDHELPHENEKEKLKHVNEMEALAYALVGCDVDLEIADVETLSPRPGKATPDFEAILRGGRRVRIELSRLTDEDEKRYLDVLGKIARMVEKKLAGIDGTGGGGEVVFRFYGDTPPTVSDVKAASAEVVQVIIEQVARASPSSRLYAVGPERPTLHALGTYWALRDREGPTRMSVDPSRQRANQRAATATFLPIIMEKRTKFADYSDGKPVWLVLYVDTRLFYPLGVINSLRGETSFDPAPFERVMLGCFTAGVIFEEANRRPQYSSLTTDG
jgi:hypothetical protein